MAPSGKTAAFNREGNDWYFLSSPSLLFRFSFEFNS